MLAIFKEIGAKPVAEVSVLEFQKSGDTSIRLTSLEDTGFADTNYYAKEREYGDHRVIDAATQLGELTRLFVQPVQPAKPGGWTPISKIGEIGAATVVLTAHPELARRDVDQVWLGVARIPPITKDTRTATHYMEVP